jgi:ParB-like chromosome segregation protein Spo0J
MNTQNNGGDDPIQGQGNQSIVYIQPDAISTAKSKYNIFPPLLPDEFAALKSSIAQYGVLIPRIVDEEGNVVEGWHRSLACKELGIPCPTIVRRFGSEAEKMEIAATANGNRRHLNTQQKRTVIADYLKADPEIADNFLAELLSVSKNTVAAVRAELEADRQIDKLTMLRGKDGKLYPREKAKQKKPKAKTPTKTNTAPAEPPVGNAPPAPAGNATGEPDDGDDDDGDDDDGNDSEEEQADLHKFKVLWRRVAEGQATIAVPDHEAASRKVRQLAEQRSALEIQSDSRPVVEVMQVTDGTGQAVAVSRTGELGLETALAETDHETVAPTSPPSTPPVAPTDSLPKKPTEDNPATVTLFNKKYEVAWTAGMWFRRADQQSGWVACTKEFAAIIEAQLAAGD